MTTTTTKKEKIEGLLGELDQLDGMIQSLDSPPSSSPTIPWAWLLAGAGLGATAVEIATIALKLS